jgi:hypothetical protein
MASKAGAAPVSADDYAGYIQQGEEAVAGDSLAAVRAMAISLMDKERAVEAAKTALEQAEAALRQVREHDLPDLMEQYELPSFSFKDESSGAVMKVAIGKEMRVSLPKDNRPAGFAWLRKNKLASIIKTDVVIPVGRDAKSLPKKINTAIKKIDKTLKGTFQEKVEPATLKATIVALLEEGKKVPLDIFNVFDQTVANVSVD